MPVYANFHWPARGPASRNFGIEACFCSPERSQLGCNVEFTITSVEAGACFFKERPNNAAVLLIRYIAEQLVDLHQLIGQVMVSELQLCLVLYGRNSELKRRHGQ